MAEALEGTPTCRIACITAKWPGHYIPAWMIQLLDVSFPKEGWDPRQDIVLGDPEHAHGWKLSSDPAPCGWAANPSSRWHKVVQLHVYDTSHLQCRPLLALTLPVGLPGVPTHLIFVCGLSLASSTIPSLTVQFLRTQDCHVITWGHIQECPLWPWRLESSAADPSAP